MLDSLLQERRSEDGDWSWSLKYIIWWISWTFHCNQEGVWLIDGTFESNQSSYISSSICNYSNFQYSNFYRLWLGKDFKLVLLAGSIPHCDIRDVFTALNCSPVPDFPIPQVLCLDESTTTACHQLAQATVDDRHVKDMGEEWDWQLLSVSCMIINSIYRYR